MPRYYVKNKENKWNIFSSIIDDFLCEEWLEFEELEKMVITDVINKKREELKSLLTDKPELNIMNYEEAIKMCRKENK